MPTSAGLDEVTRRLIWAVGESMDPRSEVLFTVNRRNESKFANAPLLRYSSFSQNIFVAERSILVNMFLEA